MKLWMCGGRLWCYSTVYSFKLVQLAQDAVRPPCRWGCGQDQTHLMNLRVLAYRHFSHSLFLDAGLSNKALTKWLPLFIVERCLFGGKPGRHPLISGVVTRTQNTAYQDLVVSWVSESPNCLHTSCTNEGGSYWPRHTGSGLTGILHLQSLLSNFRALQKGTWFQGHLTP